MGPRYFKMKCTCIVQNFSKKRVWLSYPTEWLVVVWSLKSFASLCDPMMVVCQDPLFMGFPRQESWSGLQFPSPGDSPHWGIRLGSPAWQVGLPPSHLGRHPAKSDIIKSRLTGGRSAHFIFSLLLIFIDILKVKCVISINRLQGSQMTTSWKNRYVKQSLSPFPKLHNIRWILESYIISNMLIFCFKRQVKLNKILILTLYTWSFLFYISFV